MAIDKASGFLLFNNQTTVQVREYSDGYWTIDLTHRDVLHGYRPASIPLACGTTPIDQHEREAITQRCAMVLNSMFTLTGQVDPF